MLKRIHEKNMTLLDAKDKAGGYTFTKKEREQLLKWRAPLERATGREAMWSASDEVVGHWLWVPSSASSLH